MFSNRRRLNYNTFNFLISIVVPFLQKQNTHLKDSISVKTWVVISLSHLSNGNTLTTYGESYGILKSTQSKIVREFYRAKFASFSHSKIDCC